MQTIAPTRLVRWLRCCCCYATKSLLLAQHRPPLHPLAEPRLCALSRAVATACCCSHRWQRTPRMEARGTQQQPTRRTRLSNQRTVTDDVTSVAMIGRQHKQKGCRRQGHTRPPLWDGRLPLQEAACSIQASVLGCNFSHRYHERRQSHRSNRPAGATNPDGRHPGT